MQQAQPQLPPGGGYMGAPSPQPFMDSGPKQAPPEMVAPNGGYMGQPMPGMMMQPKPPPPADLGPLLSRAQSRYSPLLGGGRNPAAFHPHQVQGILQQLTKHTRNPGYSNLAGLYTRFLGNQGVS